jgi:surfactin synthase thioesterase subunit
MQMLTPMIRADVEAFETYRFKPDEPPLDYPIIAFGGTQDPRVSRERIEGWALQTSSRFQITYFPGDHFFVNTAKDSILRSVSESIKALLAAKSQSR